MKLNRLETHDRLLHFKKEQTSNMFQGIDDCLKKNPDALYLQTRSPYIYVFVHARTHDNGVDKRILWQPRLNKPSAETNSCLFRAISNTDLIEKCWILPPEELWDEYKKGNMTEDEEIERFIYMYLNQKKKLEAKHPDDFSLEKANQIWDELKMIKRNNTLMERMYGQRDL